VLQRLAGVVVGVPEPAETVRFLTSGLDFTVREQADEWLVMCAGDYGDPRLQVALVLRPRPAVELIELRFDIARDVDLDRLAESIGTQPGAQVDGARDGVLRFRDPNGIPVAGGAWERPNADLLDASGLRPRRLGHANLKVPDPAGSTRFWVETLGLWLSEQIGDDLAFLRYGGEHHNLGLRVGDRMALHHLGFEIPGWEAYRPVLDHLAAAGYGVEFGPGRHAVGRNMFTYLVDPSSGLRLELFCDMARVEHQNDPAVAPIRWRAEDRMTRTLNVWGSAPPPPSFLE